MKNFQEKLGIFLLGAIVAVGFYAGVASALTCTNNFPTSLNNYVPGNCIPSSWGNSLEAKIGITQSSATSSLDYQVNKLQSSYGSEVAATSALNLSGTANQVTVTIGATSSFVFSLPSQLSLTNASLTSLTASSFLQGSSLSISGQSAEVNVSTTNITASGYGTFPTLNSTNATISGLNFTNGTGTSVNATNLTATNVSSTNGDFTGRLTVGGFPVSTSTSGSSGSQTITATAGGTVNTNDAVFINNTPIQQSPATSSQIFAYPASSSTVQNSNPVFFGITTSSLVSQSFLNFAIKFTTLNNGQNTYVLDIDSIGCTQGGASTPQVQIVTDNGGVPSGTVLQSTSGAYGACPNDTDQIWVFNTPTSSIPLSPNTNYWITFGITGSYQSSGNRMEAFASGSATTTPIQSFAYNNTTSSAGWTTTSTVSSGFQTTPFIKEIMLATAPNVLQAGAGQTTSSQAFVGFVQATTTISNTATITTIGTVTTFNGALTPGSLYYLSNTSGSISTTAGSNTRKVGISTNSSTLLITNEP